MKKNITIKNVDITLLRNQRDCLLGMNGTNPQIQENLDGVVNLLDAMLDIAEGFTVAKPKKGKRPHCWLDDWKPLTREGRACKKQSYVTIAIAADRQAGKISPGKDWFKPYMAFLPIAQAENARIAGEVERLKIAEKEWYDLPKETRGERPCSWQYEREMQQELSKYRVTFFEGFDYASA